PVARLDPPVRAALRLGAYQLAFSEVAVHAAVNETVELVRAAGLERAVKFANAVMRRLTLGLRELVDAGGGAAAALVSRLGRRGVVARPRRRRRTRPDAGAERVARAGGAAERT